MRSVDESDVFWAREAGVAVETVGTNAHPFSCANLSSASSDQEWDTKASHAPKGTLRVRGAPAGGAADSDAAMATGAEGVATPGAGMPLGNDCDSAGMTVCCASSLALKSPGVRSANEITVKVLAAL